mgnify:CR=1 FL=1|jgi:hypothetical protein
MIQHNDKLVLDTSDDNELKDYLGTKSAGDECSFTVRVTLDELTDNQAVFSVEDLVIDSYRETEDAEDAEPDEEDPIDGPVDDDDHPVIMLMSKGKKYPNK